MKDRLYFVIKNHPLADSNKRTGSFLFLWYLRLNQHFLAKPVKQLINDNTLVALALLVAESLPEQKELMVRLIEHFFYLEREKQSRFKYCLVTIKKLCWVKFPFCFVFGSDG